VLKITYKDFNVYQTLKKWLLFIDLVSFW